MVAELRSAGRRGRPPLRGHRRVKLFLWLYKIRPSAFHLAWIITFAIDRGILLLLSIC